MKCTLQLWKKHQGQYESRAKHILLKDKYCFDGVKMLVLLAWDVCRHNYENINDVQFAGVKH